MINVKGPTRRLMFDPRARRVYHAGAQGYAEQVMRAHGFRIVQRWGGYAGERYGERPEIVVQLSE